MSLTEHQTFLLEEWKSLRKEMDDTISRYVQIELYAVVLTGAIWSWLATTSNVQWDPILKWLPFVTGFLFAIRGLGLILRTSEIQQYLADAEKQYAVPSELRIESRYTRWSLKMLTVYLFWPILLLATFVLPFFVRFQATDCSACLAV